MRKPKKDGVLILRVPPALLVRLRRAARRRGISVSELVRRAANEECEARGKAA